MAKYAELMPAQVREKWDAGAVAVIPWGALEWHGDHLPTGLDGIVAEAFAERLTDALDGVLLPGVWLSITTLPHASSLQIRTETLRMILDDVLSGLILAGATSIAIVTGHYAQAQLIEMLEGALRAMDDYPGIRVFAASPLQRLSRPDLLDHAARYETSQLLALRPDLVEVDGLPETLSTREHCVLGEDPRTGTAAEGEELTQLGVDSWQAWITGATTESLRQDYKEAFDDLESYTEQFFTGSWDEALLQWWEAKG